METDTERCEPEIVDGEADCASANAIPLKAEEVKEADEELRRWLKGMKLKYWVALTLFNGGAFAFLMWCLAKTVEGGLGSLLCKICLWVIALNWLYWSLHIWTICPEEVGDPEESQPLFKPKGF